MTRLAVAGHLAFSAALMAQATAAGSHVVRGVVYDSVARAPLAGAIVQAVMVDSSRARRDDARLPTFSAIADSAGRYELTGLPAGLFAVGFQHDALDAFELESPVAGLVLGSETVATLDLATPSFRRIRASVCPTAPFDGVIAGYVVDGRTGSAVKRAKVELEWLEVVLRRGKLQSAPHAATAAFHEGGRFSACGIPMEGPVLMRVTASGFHPIETEVSLTNGGVARLDFRLSDTGRTAGNARIAIRVMNDSAGMMKTGQAVIPALDREAEIENGLVTIGDLPGGTWSVTLRAFGYRPVSLMLTAATENVPASIVSMERVVQPLDPVNIVADRTKKDNKILAEIDERMRVAAGTLIRQDNLSLRNALLPSEALRAARGFTFRGPTDVTARPYVIGGRPTRCETARDAGTKVSMRQIPGGPPAEQVGRTIAIYLDGVRFFGGIESINRLVPPSDILAIEAYPDLISAPFLWRTNDACAVVAYWTKH